MKLYIVTHWLASLNTHKNDTQQTKVWFFLKENNSKVFSQWHWPNENNMFKISTYKYIKLVLILTKI